MLFRSWRLKENLPGQPGPARGGLESGRVDDFSFELQLRPLIFLQPLNLQECTVPHLKDLLHTCLEPDTQGTIITFRVL